MENSGTYEALIDQAVRAYEDKEIGECRRLLADYFGHANERASAEFPRNLEEEADLWYAVMIDTGLFGGYPKSPERVFFENVATHKFAAAPPELREKFMAGLDTYFPPGTEGGEGTA